MSFYPSNAFKNVVTYQRSGLVALQNSTCMIKYANKMYENFQTKPANLGDTISFTKPFRGISRRSLIVDFQASDQRFQTLTVSQQASYANAFTAQQFLFNAEQFMKMYGDAAINELGPQVEYDVGLNLISRVEQQDAQGNPSGVFNTDSGPYRAYGNGISPINSFGQLAQALANFKDFGFANSDLVGVIPLTYVPAIVNSGLGQFAMDRNNDLAMSWELGTFGGCRWMASNLLPTQIAGTVGNSQKTLTLVSTNDPTGQNITQLTFTVSGGGNDADAIKMGDSITFQTPSTLTFRTFTGHKVCRQKVQVRATADAEQTSGTVVINIFPALVSANLATQNLSQPLAAGMTASVAPSCSVGAIMSGDALYLGMPQLPDTVPFPSGNDIDTETGASMRHYYGTQFGLNSQGYVHDLIWGSTLVPEYSMRLNFTLG